MELHTLKEKETELLSRRRVSMMIDNDSATPSRLEVLKHIAKKYSTPEDQVVIRHMYPQFGNKKTKVIAHLYHDKSKMAVFEDAHLISKHKPKQAEAKKEE
jgi:ribosomal protein S24E